SSRRRHTRWPRDWSSDVCSSDLETFWNGLTLAFTVTSLRSSENCSSLAANRWLRCLRHLLCWPWEHFRGPWGRSYSDGSAIEQEIGRASCRERVWESVVGGAVQA